jgi:hypothetical protein
MTTVGTRTAGELLDQDELRAHVEWLAAQPRESATPGERAAGERIARTLEDLGYAVRRDAERVHGTYWWPIGLPTAAAALAGATRSRVLAAVGGVLAALAVADDIAVGRRRLRRLLPQRETVNVWTEVGDADAPRTVVVVAHHDAAHSGLVFHPVPPRALLRRLPRALFDRANTTPPTLWGGVAGPALVAAGGLLGSRRLRAAGTLLCAGYVAAMADIGLRPAVPGANDNATGVAAGLSLAHWLADGAPAGVRVILLFTGAEESLMEGMVAWCDRHLAGLDRDGTVFLCLDTLGSSQLLALEGEGFLNMHEYPRDVLDLIHEAAEELGVFVHRDLRFHNGTDGQVPLLRGYRSAMIGSADELKIPSDYHWPTDTPDRVDYGSVADAARLSRRVIERVAAGAL